MAEKKRRPTELEWADIRSLAKTVRKSAEPLPAKLSSLDKTKYELCTRLLIYMREHELSQRELAVELGVVESRVSEVLHYKIQNLTLDRLVKYHQILDPDFSLKIA